MPYVYTAMVRPGTRQCGAGGAGPVPWAELLQRWRGSQQLTSHVPAPAPAQHTRPLSPSLYHGNTSQPATAWPRVSQYAVQRQTRTQLHYDDYFWSCKRIIGKVFTITEKAPTRAFSWLKVPSSAFTFKTLLRDFAKQAVSQFHVYLPWAHLA